jgi:hypothetical protein
VKSNMLLCHSPVSQSIILSMDLHLVLRITGYSYIHGSLIFFSFLHQVLVFICPWHRVLMGTHNFLKFRRDLFFRIGICHLVRFLDIGLESKIMFLVWFTRMYHVVHKGFTLWATMPQLFLWGCWYGAYKKWVWVHQMYWMIKKIELLQSVDNAAEKWENTWSILRS